MTTSDTTKTTAELVIVLSVPCRENIPDHVLLWMQQNIAAHVEQEFSRDYDADYVTPRWAGPPLPIGAQARVQVSRVRQVPPPDTTDEDHCSGVAAKLRERGIEAYSEHTGGGIFCVILPTTDKGHWMFGLADDCWAGGYSDAGGVYFDQFYVTTDVRSGDTDYGKVANAINAALTPFTQGAAFIVREQVK